MKYRINENLEDLEKAKEEARDDAVQTGLATVHRVESDSKPGLFYDVTVFKDNRGTTCSCPAWKYRGRTCKHILRIDANE